MNSQKGKSHPLNFFGKIAARVFFAVALSLILCSFPLENIESFLYDLRVRFRSPSPVSGKVQTVVLNEESLVKLGEKRSPEQFAAVLENIESAKPKAIVSLIYPTSVKGSESGVKKLVEVTKSLDSFFVAGGPNKYETPELKENLRLDPPFEHLFLTMGSVPVDNENIFAKDFVSRRLTISFQGQEILHPMIGRMFNGFESYKEYRGQFEFFRTRQAYTDYHKTGTYKPLLFEDVMEGKFDPSDFEDKVVVIGYDTKKFADQYVKTPFSRNLYAMTRLEAHANIFDTMIQNRSPYRLPGWANKLLTIFTGIFILTVVLTFNPALGLLTLVGVFFLYSVVGLLTLDLFNIWVPLVHPLLVLFVCYYFTIPYRLIIENRRSWEYYQKHKLLKEVEELKTNFLSMMSHDIKTPIARIQGMTEILSSDANKLSEGQKKAVETIHSSIDDLSSFISTVLDLGRIENQRIQLKLQSKDVNQVMKEVIRKHEFLAKNKNIEIVQEFETLFSIKIDVDLMAQVFANLVENAIKYSPEGSKILVSTEETEGQIVIQVADQGSGISEDEIKNIFMKFYRSKNAKSSPISGSGLGLYLAHYFVQLHKGEITAESTVGQGSTFTVTLPT